MPSKKTESSEPEPPTAAAAAPTVTRVVGMMRDANTCGGEWDPIDRELHAGDVICFDEPDYIPTVGGERRVIIRRAATT